MKIFKLLIALIFITGLFSSCDKVEAPYKEEVVKPVTEKTVLLEDFTGATCPNCTMAHEVAHELVETYGEENLILVAVHAGNFAVPVPVHFPYDFRTDAGTAYNNYFAPTGYPYGTVNRTNTGGDYILDRDDWGTEIAKELLEEAVVGINISTTLENSKISGDIEIEFLTDISQATSLQIWVIEDSIIQPQIVSGEGRDPNYVHSHVLRGAINGDWGEALPANAYSAGNTETISFSNFPMGADWVAKQSSVVAFVYENETKKVLQAAKVHLVE